MKSMYLSETEDFSDNKELRDVKQMDGQHKNMAIEISYNIKSRVHENVHVKPAPTSSYTTFLLIHIVHLPLPAFCVFLHLLSF